jgi:hypothetical protein
MGRGDSALSAYAPGSARIRDICFPDFNTAGAGATTGALRCRITGAQIVGATITNLGSLVTTQNVFFQGVDCQTINNTGAAGAGGSVSWLNICNVAPLRTTKPANWPLDDDWNVHRVVWVASMSQTPTSTNDTGLQLINSNTASEGIIRTPRAGLGLQFSTTGLSFLANNGGGPVQTVLATNGVGGYNAQDWHAYELRIFNALPTSDAFIKVVIDNVIVATISWAGGTLPVPSAAAVAFFPALWNNSTGGGAVCTHYLGFQAAQSELALF